MCCVLHVVQCCAVFYCILFGCGVLCLFVLCCAVITVPQESLSIFWNDETTLKNKRVLMHLARCYGCSVAAWNDSLVRAPDSRWNEFMP